MTDWLLDGVLGLLLLGLVCGVWALCGALQWLRPQQLWAAPALAAWLLVAAARRLRR